MESDVMSSRRRILLSVFAVACVGFAPGARAADASGILLLAHGSHRGMGHGAAHDHAHHDSAPAARAPQPTLGPDIWNQNIEVIAADLNRTVPTEVAFGMAEPQAMQAAADRLVARGVSHIVAVPLYISSHSPIIGNFRYILGLQEQMGQRTAIKKLARVHSKATFAFSGAMDADPLVSEILLERARAKTDNPATTNLVIIAHGPNDEEDNKLWLADMEKHAAYLKARGFRSVEVLTHRNDADAATKAAARAAFRARVETAARDGTTVVVPLLMSAGGIEKDVEDDLKGLTFVFAQPLAPHPNLERWVLSRYQVLRGEQ